MYLLQGKIGKLLCGGYQDNMHRASDIRRDDRIKVTPTTTCRATANHFSSLLFFRVLYVVLKMRTNTYAALAVRRWRGKVDLKSSGMSSIPQTHKNFLWIGPSVSLLPVRRYIQRLA